ncbi:hypothetical protein [Clostridium sp. 'White wine YQ']|uniref:hypothetical protein n=1 Tax=Clostridium sp. 'White wine YQ' TaxID=3027474 RepID=UPI002365D6D8|nr:hypothetical protein [Clostridium sp. 'White wine YQ']MDD7793687.1 hypothetical protein [Clostridium sp. 'White wine YQ']
MEVFKIKRKYISKWELEVGEISNNYWEGIARRNSGNIVTCQGFDPEEIMKRLEVDFWCIELKLTNNTSNLISTYLNERTAYDGQKVCLLEQPEYFGSWTISNESRQVMYDGKEQWFVMRFKKNEVNWIDQNLIKLNEVSPEKINQLYTWLIECVY